MFSQCFGGKKPSGEDQQPRPTATGQPPERAGETTRPVHPKKYLVLVRHGERIDETFPESLCVAVSVIYLNPERTADRGDEYWDTGITERGMQHSKQTGAAILKMFDEWGMLDQMLEQINEAGKATWVVRKIRFISSIFYRCLQTTQCIRHGMEEYIEQQLLQNASNTFVKVARKVNASEFQRLKGTPDANLIKNQRRNEVLKAILLLLKSRSTHIEEACSEKIAGVPPSVINKLRIEKDKQKCLQEFADLKIVTGEIFDYSGKHKHLSVKKLFNKGSEIYDACEDFYRRIIKRLLEAPNHNIYVVVAHGMCARPAKIVNYNSTSIIEFDDILRDSGVLATQESMAKAQYESQLNDMTSKHQIELSCIRSRADEAHSENTHLKTKIIELETEVSMLQQNRLVNEATINRMEQKLSQANKDQQLMNDFLRSGSEEPSQTGQTGVQTRARVDGQIRESASAARRARVLEDDPQEQRVQQKSNLVKSVENRQSEVPAVESSVLNRPLSQTHHLISIDIDRADQVAAPDFETFRNTDFMSAKSFPNSEQEGALGSISSQSYHEWLATNTGTGMRQVHSSQQMARHSTPSQPEAKQSRRNPLTKDSKLSVSKEALAHRAITEFEAIFDAKCSDVELSHSASRQSLPHPQEQYHSGSSKGIRSHGHRTPGREPTGQRTIPTLDDRNLQHYGNMLQGLISTQSSQQEIFKEVLRAGRGPFFTHECITLALEQVERRGVQFLGTGSWLGSDRTIQSNPEGLARSSATSSMPIPEVLVLHIRITSKKAIDLHHVKVTNYTTEFLQLRNAKKLTNELKPNKLFVGEHE